MASLGNRPLLLQLIQNMVVGGAQRTASRLMNLPGITVELATYDQINRLSARNYAGVLLHVWCAVRDSATMNWPPALDLNTERLLVFNHDWHGELNVKADAYIVYSRFTAENVRADGPVLIIPGAIPLHYYRTTTRTERQLPGKVSVGRLSTMHSGKINIDTIHYWPQIAADTFWVAGDGPELAKIKKTYQSDSRFRFPGQINPREVPQFLTNIDIFLYDTAWHIESFCYVILEAMAAGCVVVARDQGAIAELISPGVDGFLFHSDEQAIDVCNMLIHDPGLRSRVSMQARQHATLYSLDRFYETVLSAFGWA